MTELSKIDKYVIAKVREKRELSEMSQIELSQRLDMTDSFVGHVETPKRRAKYNLQHINLLAKIFKCSPRDFLPEKSL
jgi:transcriptional regulator with XRE-family HTH domain